MSEFLPQDQARLRRVFRFIDDEAPLSPGLDDLEAPSLTPSRSLRTNSWWVAASVFAGTLLLAVPVAFLMNSGRPTGLLGAPTPTTEATTTTTTTPAVTTPERLPVDGRPGDLGVESVSFVGAVFPTSINEIRTNAVWEAARTNVESGWVEACMEDRGATIEIPRVLAYDLRRQAAIPDFELDAEFGFYDPTPEEWTPAPPPGSTSEEAAAWDLAYSECSLEAEAKRSEEFDQVLGEAPSWFDIVDQVTASPEMQAVTDQMLQCIAELGGPDVEMVMELYSDRIGQYGEDSLDDLIAGGLEKAKLIEQCAGDYDVIRESLLLPERQAFIAEYGDILAVAELYFNEVVAEAGIDVDE